MRQQRVGSVSNSEIPRIPRRIKLPYGYVVRVRILDHDEFVEENGTIVGAWWKELQGGGVIDLDGSRPPGKMVTDFAHEFGHAIVDWLNHVYHLPGVRPRG